MRTTSFRALLLSAAALLVSGCDSLFEVEVEAEEICKVEDDLSFPAAPPVTFSLQQAFRFPLGDVSEALPADAEVESSLRLKRFEVTATTDISGIERASVSVRKPGTTEAILVGEFRRTSTAPTRTLRLTSSAAVDILDLARQDELEFIFEVRGSLPSQAWSADVDACAGVRAKAKYFDVAF